MQSTESKSPPRSVRLEMEWVKIEDIVDLSRMEKDLLALDRDDFIALTDHNQVTIAPQTKSLIVIPGVELPAGAAETEIMRLAVRYGLPRKALMRLLLKIMANLPQERGGRLDDHVINALSRMTPAA